MAIGGINNSNQVTNFANLADGTIPNAAPRISHTVHDFAHPQTNFLSPREAFATKIGTNPIAQRAGISGDYDKFQKLTGAEKWFVVRHPFVAREFQADATKALGEAQSRFPSDQLHNGRGDAFRHAYWNALMTKHQGSDLAEEFATAHESNPDQPANEKEMDLHNNAVGRRIARENPNATDQELAQLVMQALENGELKTLK